MNYNFNELIDFNINQLNKTSVVYKLEFRGLDQKILCEEICLALFNKLVSESLIDEDYNGKIYLLSKALEIINYGGWIKYLTEAEKHTRVITEKNNIKESLEIKNLKLQNENFEYSKTLRIKEDEIRTLTGFNLKLQNRQLARYIFYSIFSFISGVLLTNLTHVLDLFRKLTQ
ncbi:hypothetical protein IWX84_001486 [Flavobacterium sp. CG_9.10]|uniref:hypothetical protein n=1 Tax=Flavobacterium sp. CG_9.10 TaxID=2787729 RepID=UPI0018CA4A73|nr:hypothetical protein [Flavobacterium sp. CG_9.10]MBG6110607.1 hypothetical protein [Flavobacterium sp. CG_9.10]